MDVYPLFKAKINENTIKSGVSGTPRRPMVIIGVDANRRAVPRRVVPGNARKRNATRDLTLDISRYNIA